MVVKIVNHKESKEEEVISALEQAAKDMGFRCKTEENFRTDYELGSLKEIQAYTGSTVYLRMGVLGRLELQTRSHLMRNNWFLLNSSFVSKETVEKYLSKVSEYLK
ncbi:MAG: hypothetical protein KJ767_02510 [Nanoarchaeota archaeon]|nr:hypothetical protein [Nanoarchaeota archaeon]